MTGKTVLVVDDEFDLLQTICATLELGGYRTVCAGNGREALQKLAAGARPDLLLTDVMMPYMSGYDLVAAVRKLPDGKELPALLMSAIDPALHPQGSWDGVLPKPFTLDDLLEKVAALIGPGEAQEAA